MLNRLLILVGFSLGCTSLTLGQDGSEAQAEEFDTEPERCILVNRVDSTDVIDDETIAFTLRDRSIYLNTLDRRCFGLKRADRFMYEVRGARLCDSDWITVLERFGTGFDRGMSCPLGQFHPTTADALLALEAAAEGESARPAATATPVDLAADEDAEPAAEAP